MPELRLRIIPEFEENAIRGFADKVNKSVGGAGAAGARGATGGISAGVGSIAQIAGVGALAGGGALALLEQVLTQFRPLVAIIKQISRTLLEFLRPIAEVVIVLLQPVLAILQPLLRIFQALMAPFRQAALQLSAESQRAFAQGDPTKGFALAGLAAATILKPLTDILLQIQAEAVKLLIDVITSIPQTLISFISIALGAFIGLFNDELGEKIIAIGGATVAFLDSQAEILKGGVQSAVDSVKQQGNNAIMDAAAALGVDVILPAVSDDNGTSIFSQMKSSLNVFKESIVGIIEDDTFGDEGILGAFQKGMDEFRKKGVRATEDAFSELNGTFASLADQMVAAINAVAKGADPTGFGGTPISGPRARRGQRVTVIGGTRG